MMLWLLLPALLARAERVFVPLKLSGHGGAAPYSVKVLGPPALLEKAAACRLTFAGYGFTVDWGDGLAVPVDRDRRDCPKLLTHTYTVAGTYVVKAGLSHPGPTDEAVSDWTGSDRVVVTASAKTPFSLRLLDDLGGRELHYGAGSPAVRYAAETGEPAELLAEIVRNDGKVLYSTRKAIGNSGEGRVAWSGYADGPAAEEYRNGVIHARARLTLSAQGKKPVRREGKPFELRASATFRPLDVSPASGRAPLAVEAGTKILHPDCYSYVVDWGDGARDRAKGFVPGKACALRSDSVKLRHTYGRPGRYRIRWYDNNLDPAHEAREGPGYLEREVRVSGR
jgi:hypothetical protein